MRGWVLFLIALLLIFFLVLFGGGTGVGASHSCQLIIGHANQQYHSLAAVLELIELLQVGQGREILAEVLRQLQHPTTHFDHSLLLTPHQATYLAQLSLWLGGRVHLLEGLQGDEHYSCRQQGRAFLCEFSVEEHHLGEVEQDLGQILGRLLCKREVQFLQGVPGDIIERGGFQFKAQSLDDQRLSLQNLTLLEFLPCDLIMHHCQLQRMDLLILGCREHGSHADQVQVFALEAGPAETQVGVHEVDAAEEGLLAHVVGGEHLDHPVHHLGPQSAAYIVSRQCALLSLSPQADVTEDILRVVPGHLFGVELLEISPECLPGRERGGGGLADLVLEFGLDGEFVLGANGLGEGQVGVVGVLLVLLTVAQGGLVVADGAVGLGLISHLTIIQSDQIGPHQIAKQTIKISSKIITLQITRNSPDNAQFISLAPENTKG